MSADALAIVEAAIRLATVIWQWLADEAYEQPVTASLVALATLLDTKPEARQELVERARANPVLRKQLLDLCDAYAERWPVFARVKQELEAP
jgi:hypothetical protein